MAGIYSVNAQLVNRFCKALLDLAIQNNAVDTIQQELQQLGAAIEQSPELKTLITTPILRREQKLNAIVEILKKSGASGLLVNFAGTLANNNRLNLLPEIVTTFAEKLAEMRGEVSAEVISARPLEQAQMQQLQTELSKMFAGKKIVVTPKVDPNLLGGVAVRVGSMMIDGSLRTKFEGLSLALKGAA